MAHWKLLTSHSTSQSSVAVLKSVNSPQTVVHWKLLSIKCTTEQGEFYVLKFYSSLSWIRNNQQCIVGLYWNAPQTKAYKSQCSKNVAWELPCITTSGEFTALVLDLYTIEDTKNHLSWKGCVRITTLVMTGENLHVKSGYLVRRERLIWVTVSLIFVFFPEAYGLCWRMPTKRDLALRG